MSVQVATEEYSMWRRAQKNPSLLKIAWIDPQLLIFVFFFGVKDSSYVSIIQRLYLPNCWAREATIFWSAPDAIW